MAKKTKDPFPEISDEHFQKESERRDVARNKHWIDVFNEIVPERDEPPLRADDIRSMVAALVWHTEMELADLLTYVYGGHADACDWLKRSWRRDREVEIAPGVTASIVGLEDVPP